MEKKGLEDLKDLKEALAQKAKDSESLSDDPAEVEEIDTTENTAPQPALEDLEESGISQNAPEKRERKHNPAIEQTRERLASQFVGSPSENEKGKTLKTTQIEKNFRAVMMEDHDVPPYIGYYLTDRYLAIPNQYIAQLLDQAGDKNLGQHEATELRRQAAEWQRYRDDVMRGIYADPKSYGLDIDMIKANVRPEPYRAEYYVEMLKSLDPEVQSLARDDEYFFFVNGSELPLKDVAKVSQDLVRLVAPEGKEGRLGVKRIRQECLSTYFDQLAELRYAKNDDQNTKLEKAEMRKEIYANLTDFLHEIVVEGKFDAYHKVAYEGKRDPGVELRRQLFTKPELRLPAKIEEKLDQIRAVAKKEKRPVNKAAVNSEIRDFFHTRVTDGETGEAYLAPIRQQYLERDVGALYDEAGPKWITLFTEEIDQLFREAGITSIDDQYAGELGGLVDTRARLLKAYNEADKTLNDLQKKEDAKDTDIGTATEALNKAEAALKKNDKEIVELVQMTLTMPEFYNAKNAGESKGRKAIEVKSELDDGSADASGTEDVIQL